MSVFNIILFFLMLIMGGIAVDLMRFENQRVAVQQTMDRATLAAASLEQKLVPKDVVEDYFRKAGILDKLTSVTVTQTVNSRNVNATADVYSKNLIMPLVNVDFLQAVNTSEAEQRVNDIEIILVLDISGSMSGVKITDLKAAAKEFVDTVMGNDPMGRVSIGIVPYSAQVNLGAPLISKYNVSYRTSTPNSNCIELPTTVYSTTALSRTTELPQMVWADAQSGTSQSTSYVAFNDSSSGAPVNDRSYIHCKATTTDDVTLPSKNPTLLKSRIDALFADGNTSIMLGMRWGVALLDPGARPMYNELIGSGNMTSDMSLRPYEFTNKDARKVVVLMTDGEHVVHTRVTDAYKGGTSATKSAISPIFRAPDGKFSIRFTTGRPTGITNQYWVPHLCISTNCKAGTNTSEAWTVAAYTNNATPATQQRWDQVWSVTRPAWVAWQLYARALGNSSSTRTTQYNTAMGNFRSTFMSVASMNSSLDSNCTAAKTAGMTVYGIAFEAPTTGQAVISKCASQPTSSYYYLADANLKIGDVFRLIAANISQLRLTQ